MIKLLRFAGSLFLLGACQSTQHSLQQVPVKLAAERQVYEQRRLVKSQFASLDMLVAQGLEVQRVDLMWGLQDFPSVEMTRNRDGVVTIALKYWGHEHRQLLPDQLWDDMAARARVALVPWDSRGQRSRTRVVGRCHDWHELEAALDGQQMRVTASPCPGRNRQASLDYANALARIAIDNISICEPDRQAASIPDALAACSRRFGPPTEEYRAQVN